MKITISQLAPSTSIEENIKGHIADIQANKEADIILFPELSITGYFPSHAKQHTYDRKDAIFDPFVQLSAEHDMVIAVGFPMKTTELPVIAMQFFFPNGQRHVHVKTIIHEDEAPYFTSQGSLQTIDYRGVRMLPAICFEATQKQTIRFAIQNKVDLYLAAVAKDEQGMVKMETSTIPLVESGVTVAVSNAIGEGEGFVAVGKSYVETSEGKTLIEGNEGLVSVDSISLKTALTPEEQLKYPTLIKRIQAAFADIFILILLAYSFSEIFANLEIISEESRLYTLAALYFIYDPLFTALTGGTPGHHIVGIRVRKSSNSEKKINYFAALLRYTLKTFLGWISLLTVSSEPRKRAIHDLAVGSLVEWKEGYPKR